MCHPTTRRRCGTENARIWATSVTIRAPGGRRIALLHSPVVDLERLIAALAPAEVVGRAPTDVHDLAYDARAAGPGSLFFCVPGQRADGHDFAAEAVGHGAVALVVERPLDLRVPQLVVPDSRAAMAVAADEFFGRPTEELTVAGITGTNGKTTTAFLLYAVLAAAGRRPGLLGTVETRVDGERRPATRTTAEAIDLQGLFREMLDAGDRSCVLEATSHGSALRRLDRVRFGALVFTNLSQDHLDFHRDLEDYFQAKRRLFVGVDAPPAAVNVGDAHGRRLAEELRERGGPLVTFGFADDAEIRPEGIAGTSAVTSLTAGGIRLRTRLRGHFNLENVLATVAAARLLGLPDESVATGVESLAGVPGRFEPIEEGQPFTVIVDYAHKPGALENVLRAARELTAGRVICVLGCGGDRDRGKRPLMGRIASDLADVTVVTSDNPRSEDPLAIIEEILAGIAGQPEVEPDRRRAIERAVELAAPGRRRRDRRQGARARAGDRRPRPAVRRPRGGRGGAAHAAGDRVIALSLGEVAELAPGRLEAAPWAEHVTGLKTDSRRVEEGDLFVAVGGGADFAKHAFARGAAAVLLPDDAFAALAALAGRVRGRSPARFVAITGSMGKTSTKDILAAICAPQRRTVAAERSYNAEIGVPLTIGRVEEETEICILELAMRGFGQIAELCAFARPHLGVITNVGPVHLEKVGDLAGVIRAKGELVEALPAGATIVVPADFPVERADLDVVRVGVDVTLGSFDPPVLETSLGTVEVDFSARHLAANALTALATARALGLEFPSRIEVDFTEWRNQELPLPGGGVLVNDAWNANPVSMRAALEHLATLAGERRTVAVLGDMAELGEHSDEGHREVARAVEAVGIELVVAIGPRAIAYGGRHVDTVEDALVLLDELLRPGDCVLVKGARAMGLERVAEALTTASASW